MTWCFSRFCNMAAAPMESRYCLPRPKRGLILVVKNTAKQQKKFQEDVKQLQDSFQYLGFETEMVDAEDFQLEGRDLSELNVLLVVIVSDNQSGFKVTNASDDTTLDIAEITESATKNDSMLGYPKILLFTSKGLANDEPFAVKQIEDPLLEDKTNQRAEYRPHEKLMGDSTFFWDIFVAKVVPGNLQLPRFLQDLGGSVQQFHQQRDFEEIFLEVIKSNKPAHWQFLNHLRKKLFLTQGDIFKTGCNFPEYFALSHPG